MTLTDHSPTTTGDDAAAIGELEQIVERQRTAFLADPYPSLEERQGLLGALAGAVLSHRTQIQEAMSADFGVHPTEATDLIEVLGVAGRAGYAAEQLESWMAADPRETDPALFGVQLAEEGRTNKKGMPKPLDFALFVTEYRDEVVGPFPPAWMQRAAIAPLAALARRRGRGERYSALRPAIA